LRTWFDVNINDEFPFNGKQTLYQTQNTLTISCGKKTANEEFD
jgi:hypothetical protein